MYKKIILRQVQNDNDVSSSEVENREKRKK
jgi:hypothetical protein